MCNYSELIVFKYLHAVLFLRLTRVLYVVTAGEVDDQLRYLDIWDLVIHGISVLLCFVLEDYVLDTDAAEQISASYDGYYNW